MKCRKSGLLACVLIIFIVVGMGTTLYLQDVIATQHEEPNIHVLTQVTNTVNQGAAHLQRMYRSEILVIVLLCIITLIIGYIYIVKKYVAESEVAKEKLNQSYSKLKDVLGELQQSESQLKLRYNDLLHNKELLKDTQERYKLIIEASNDGIWDYDVHTKERFQSARFLEDLGYSEDAFKEASSWYQLVHPVDLVHIEYIVKQHIADKTDFYECEYRVKTSEGKYIWIKERGKAQFSEDGKVYRIAGSHTNIENLKNYEERLKQIAYTDTMTKLPNRRYLLDVVSQQFNKEDTGKKAFIFMDIDNFKVINDTLGHELGDKAIVTLAQLFSKIGGADVTLCRLEGDELVFLLNNVHSTEEIETFIAKIYTLLNDPMEIEENYLHISVSMGVSIYPDHANNIAQLLKYADIAMYRAKELGKNRHVLFDERYLERMEEIAKMEIYLRNAIKEKEFLLYYQPKVNIQAMKIIGFEALIRWDSKILGLVMPNKFIEIAENTGLINPIGEWVIEESCRFVKRMNELHKANYTIAINVSVVQLMQDNFVSNFMQIIEHCEVRPEWIEIEITETMFMKSMDSIIEKLAYLRNQGVGVALDDFGKEYSSLNYLDKLPLTTLKIDKSFMDQLMDNNSTIVDIIIQIGRRLKFKLIAEGVETLEQINYLRRKKCYNIQGYIFSRPVPELQVEDIINVIENVYVEEAKDEDTYEGNTL